MAITSSAKKALRSSKKKVIFNARRADAIKSVVKKIKRFLNDKNVKEAEVLLAEAYKALDKAAKTNFIKKGAAARKKSRLAGAIKRAKTAAK